MVKDKNGIAHTNEQEHKELVDAMKGFLDNEEPQLGIFWYEIEDDSLFGVEKVDA